MIKTVIFDIGGVLIGYDWDAYLMKHFNNDRELVNKMEFALFENGVWDEVDRGVWSEDELLEAFYKNGAGVEKEIYEFWDTVGGALWQYDFTKQLISDVKAKGVQVLYLSNWSNHLREKAAKQLDFLPLLDGGVFSYEENLIKPDHRIYERILKKYQLKAEECVFLDDNVNNVKAARECGLNAIQVVDHDKAHEELFAML